MIVVTTSVDFQSASCQLSYDFIGDDHGYPFDLRVTITYTLSPLGFKVTTNAQNKGTKSLPWAQGWHPYFTFNAPATYAERVDILTLSTPTLTKIDTDENGIPTGTQSQLVFSGSLNNTNLDVCLVASGQRNTDSSGRTITTLSHPTRKAEYVIWQDNSYPYVQVFTTWYSVAIEPLTSVTNSFNNGKGLITLKPNDNWSGSFGVYIK
jgi:aldose 1-epimerase